ncbi:head completion/stabilization protein [Erwinia pyrifoliae]|uniref:Head completion/stabilization protein n=1 Tax=Erwinia pyrifoliae TaxID=79967 RepID=A0ABY5XDG0_ERWPY|nr:head completion/stabilization protein [Erwinia pyrifoliae]MCT2387308.1 head completion/stabilization protein [Erwinia pyrifoliae]MCU8587092.1 head completion/stabilization protein [Erwinia pyrifoliae]UWS30955.1 head completion/stabilization protein [Erwinia pyrifoliae]UWS35247.1 head completion/stabilization protein [Erwinia pyrifoliae]
MNGPTFGVSGRQIDYQDVPVVNGVIFWPDLNLAEFQKSRTIPPDSPPETAGLAVLAAVAEVNSTLAPVVEYWTLRGVEAASRVPGARMGNENQLTAQYKTAVYARAKAALMGEFATVGRRETHPGQESSDSRANLLAEAAFVMRNMLNLPRVGVHLI